MACSVQGPSLDFGIGIARLCILQGWTLGLQEKSRGRVTHVGAELGFELPGEELGKRILPSP